MSVNCIPVQSHEARLIWPHVSHFIQMAIDQSSERYTTDDVLNLIEDKKAQLFIFRGFELVAAWVTTIEDSGSSKWIRFMWAGGHGIGDWLHYSQSVEQWAKSIGCTHSVVVGRPGWEKELKDKGYRKTSVILEKVI
jgi:hypothetical protein